MTALRVALVSCGKLKLDHPAPAAELYTGPLFTDARDHVLANGYDHWLILSAEHGLVDPDRVLAPYDTTIDSLTVDQLNHWARRVERGLRLGAGYLDDAGTYVPTDWPGWAHTGPVVFDAFAAAGYTDPLREATGARVTITEPLRGLGMGDRRGWFKQQRATPPT